MVMVKASRRVRKKCIEITSFIPCVMLVEKKGNCLFVIDCYNTQVLDLNKTCFLVKEIFFCKNRRQQITLKIFLLQVVCAAVSICHLLKLTSTLTINML